MRFILAIGLLFWAISARAEGPNAFLIGQELKLYLNHVAPLAPFADMNELQSRIPPADVPESFLENYVWSRSAFERLPASIRNRLILGLEYSPDENAAKDLILDPNEIQKFLGARRGERSPAPPEAPKAPSDRNMFSSQQVVTAIDTSVSDRLIALRVGGAAPAIATDTPYDMILPDSPQASKDWPKIRQRWIEILSEMSPEQKNQIIRYELLPKDAKARILMTSAKGVFELKQTLGEPIRSAFRGLHWHLDTDGSLQFKHMVPQTDPDRYLKQLYQLADLAGARSELDTPHQELFATVAYHFHISPIAQKDVPKVEVLRDQAEALPTWKEREAMAERAEKAMAQLQDKGIDYSAHAEGWNYLLLAQVGKEGQAKTIQEKAQVTYRPIRNGSYVASGVASKGFRSIRGKSRIEIRRHRGSAREELGEFQEFLKMDEPQALRFAANHVQDMLTPDVLLELIRYIPGGVLDAVIGSEKHADETHLHLRASDLDLKVLFPTPPVGSPDLHQEARIRAAAILLDAQPPSLAQINAMAEAARSIRNAGDNHLGKVLKYFRSIPAVTEAQVMVLIELDNASLLELLEKGTDRELLFSSVEKLLQETKGYWTIPGLVRELDKLAQAGEAAALALMNRVKAGEFPRVEKTAAVHLKDLEGLMQYPNYRFQLERRLNWVELAQIHGDKIHEVLRRLAEEAQPHDADLAKWLSALATVPVEAAPEISPAVVLPPSRKATLFGGCRLAWDYLSGKIARAWKPKAGPVAKK